MDSNHTLRLCTLQGKNLATCPRNAQINTIKHDIFKIYLKLRLVGNQRNLILANFLMVKLIFQHNLRLPRGDELNKHNNFVSRCLILKPEKF